jgi:hypothetical protein
VPLAGTPPSWLEVWAAVRISPQVTVGTSAAVGDLYLDLTIGAPGFSGSARGQFVKTMTDGVLTALHARADRETIGELTNRLRARLRLTAPEIQALLLDDQRAVLGARRRLLVLRDRGFSANQTTSESPP